MVTWNEVSMNSQVVRRLKDGRKALIDLIWEGIWGVLGAWDM